MSDARRSPPTSGTYPVQDGDSVALLDGLAASVAETVRSTLVERRGLGYADLADSEIESIARLLAVRTRPAVAFALFAERQTSINREAGDAFDEPTAKVFTR